MFLRTFDFWLQGEFLVSLLHCRGRIKGEVLRPEGCQLFFTVSLVPSSQFFLWRFQITGFRNGAPVEARPLWGASRKLARGHPAWTSLGARDFLFHAFLLAYLPLHLPILSTWPPDRGYAVSRTVPPRPILDNNHLLFSVISVSQSFFTSFFRISWFFLLM